MKISKIIQNKFPQSVNDWPMIEMYGTDFREELHEMFGAITELKLWDELAQFSSQSGGYTFSTENMINKIKNHEAIQKSLHSGMTFSYAMSLMKKIAVNGWDNFCKEFQNASLNPVSNFMNK